jgi:hypothetical protein
MKKMLEIITLHTIQKIFDDCETEISTITKLIYMNCFIHHFKDKDAKMANSVAFEILDTEIDFEKFKKNFHELHRAGLVTINGSVIMFNNFWSKHIDITQLDKAIDEYTPGKINFLTPEKMRADLMNSEMLQEICRMRYSITKDRMIFLIDLFIKEQTTFEKTYNSPNDCTKHFTYWLQYNKDKTSEDEKVKVKSKGRLLGK